MENASTFKFTVSNMKKVPTFYTVTLLFIIIGATLLFIDGSHKYFTLQWLSLAFACIIMGCRNSYELGLSHITLSRKTRLSVRIQIAVLFIVGSFSWTSWVFRILGLNDQTQEMLPKMGFVFVIWMGICYILYVAFFGIARRSIK